MSLQLCRHLWTEEDADVRSARVQRVAAARDVGVVLFDPEAADGRRISSGGSLGRSFTQQSFQGYKTMWFMIHLLAPKIKGP